jgi:hypothetical protein
VDTTNLKSLDLDWEEIGRFTGTYQTFPPPPSPPTLPPTTIFFSELNCSGTTWPTGLGTQHQNFNFVREGNLDGELYLLAMLRDGSVVNPFADEDEFIDLYRVNLTPERIAGMVRSSAITVASKPTIPHRSCSAGIWTMTESSRKAGLPQPSVQPTWTDRRW